MSTTPDTAETAPAEPPKIRPFDAVMLDVGDGHWIYVEEVGRKDGIPAVFLHGGPGSGSQHLHRALFDPENNHAILYDQRGAGRSHPYLCRSHNTTAHQIADLERIREFYGIERWIVTGGSWGSTLGLAYAIAHPERVAALVLRAIFLGMPREVDWAFIAGPSRFRPELFEQFVSFLPPSERADALSAYVRRINHPDPAVHTPAAIVWGAYERALSVLEPGDAKLPLPPPDDGRLPPTAIMECHYIANDFFLGKNELLANAHRLKGIPGVIVQGRYDLLCPPAAACAIAEAWPDCELTIIEQAGHAISEPGVFDALKVAIARFTASF